MSRFVNTTCPSTPYVLGIDRVFSAVESSSNRIEAERSIVVGRASLVFDRRRALVTFEDANASSLESAASNAPSPPSGTSTLTPGTAPRVSSRLSPGALDERQLAAADAPCNIIRTTLCDRQRAASGGISYMKTSRGGTRRAPSQPNRVPLCIFCNDRPPSSPPLPSSPSPSPTPSLPPCCSLEESEIT